MKRIVIGVDGSDGSAQAVRWGALLARATGAEVIAATSFHAHLASLPTRHRPEERARLTELFLDVWCEPLREAGVDFEPLVLELPPARALQLCADDNDADLLVVGASARGGLAGTVRRSVAHHLAHTCGRPLAVVPVGASLALPQRLVVGLDGSEGALAAGLWTEDLSDELGVPFTTVRVNHHNAGALLEAAPASDAGLVVVGTRSWRPPLHPRLGSVSTRLLCRSTELPVVVVPPPA